MKISTNALVALSLAVSPALVNAAAWDGGAGTLNWFDGDNWNPNGIPVANDNITITTSAGTVVAGSGVDINTLTVAEVTNGSAAVQFNADFTAPAAGITVGKGVGAVGAVTMNNADGTYAAGAIGTNGGTGTFTAKGNSAVTTTGIWQIAAGGNVDSTTNGYLNIEDTASLTLGNTLRVGATDNSTKIGYGEVNLSGGKLDLQNQNMQLGQNSSTGVFNMTGGQLTSTSGSVVDGAKGGSSLNPAWAINISGGTVSLDTGSINMASAYGGTLRVSGAGASITIGNTSLAAINLETANEQQHLVFDLAAGPDRVSAFNLTGGGADLDGVELIINALPGFAIDANDTVDLIIAERAISTTNLLFTDNTLAGFTWALVGNPGELSGSDGQILRLTATETVVPEPSALGLVGLAAVAALRRRA